MKISVILKGKADNQKRQVVYIRTNEGERRTFKATKIRVAPDQLQDGKIVKHPQAATFNQVLKRMITEIENEAVTGPGERVSATSFFEFAEREMKSWEGIKKPKTLESYGRELEKIKRFRPAFNLSDITPGFLELYRQHLIKLKNANNTQWKAFKFIKTLMTRAGVLKLVKDNPFDLFAGPKFRDPQKEYLTRVQVERIEKFARETPAEELAFCACWFVIGCYTGLRFSDMTAFDEKRNIVGGRLVVHTVKTGEVVGMPVNDKLKTLFEKVAWKGLHYSNQGYNRNLKSIAALCEIDMPIAAHFSRHTAAMLWADAGISQEVAAKLLGHTSLKSTAIYYKISNQRIDDEMKRLGL